MEKIKWNGTSGFLLMTDCHFGVNKDSEMKLDDTKRYFENDIINLCSEYGTDTILFLGDWFEFREQINVKTKQAANNVIRHLRDNNIKIIMIQGNHDLYYKNRFDVTSLDDYREYENVTLITETTILECSKRKFVLTPWKKEFPKGGYDAMFGHFDFVGAKLQETTNKTGYNPTELLKASALVFSGHFHLSSEYDFQNGRIINIGNPMETSWRDYDNPKGLYYLNLETMNYKFIKNDTGRIHRKVYWSDITKKKDSLKDIQNNYIKVVIDEEVNFKHINKLLNIINSKSPANCTLDITVPTNSTPSVEIESTVGDYSLGAGEEQQIENYLNILKEEGWLKKEQLDESKVKVVIERYMEKI